MIARERERGRNLIQAATEGGKKKKKKTDEQCPQSGGIAWSRKRKGKKGERTAVS